MARPPRPWRRGPDGPWYAQIRGRQIRLAGPSASRDQARDALAKALAGSPPEDQGESLTVRDAINLLLADRMGRIGPGTYRRFASRCRVVARVWGPRAAASLRPPEVEAWLDRQPWSNNYRAVLAKTLQAAIQLAVRAGRLDSDPLTSLRRPRGTRRDFDLDARARLIDTATEPFRSYLIVLHLTGMRPGELTDATARNLDIKTGTLRVQNKTRRQTGRETRTVYLPAEALRILESAARTRPDGPLLRTARDTPWNSTARTLAMRAIRERAGAPTTTLYVFRAGWVTDALAAGVSPAIVAELAGHSSMIMMRHYARLAEKGDELRAAVARVRPEHA